ncbi:unnamed protein product [Urochloa humidicola]
MFVPTDPQLLHSLIPTDRQSLLSGCGVVYRTDDTSGNNNAEADKKTERAFQVIEAELAFLYDVFFTKYPVTGTMTIWALASAGSMLLVMALTVVRAAGVVPTTPTGGSSSSSSKATVAENAITVTILAALALLELVQVVLYWTSNWGRFNFVCQYIQHLPRSRTRPSWSMRLKAFLSGVRIFSSRKYYWKHHIGQYSLLQSIDPPTDAPCCSLLFPRIFIRCCNTCCKVVATIGLPRGFFLPSPVSLRVLDVKVPVEVRRSVVMSLKRTDGELTNGASSLEYNGASHLLWACSLQQFIRTNAEEKGSQTRAILIWHIATGYCKLAPSSSSVGGTTTTVRHTAITLSEYCASLMISAPQLLPGNRDHTRYLFLAAAMEAASALKGRDDKYEAMRSHYNMEAEADEETIFRGGVKLGKQLEDIQDEAKRWKVIADFWSEMILYVAPSDNIKGHIEQLANGGEFITHLWALLFHAGIAKRGEHDFSR